MKDSFEYLIDEYDVELVYNPEFAGKNNIQWCILLIVLPVALVFSESSMNNIQSVSIISAFPIGIIMILMIWSFIKDAKQYMNEKGMF